MRYLMSSPLIDIFNMSRILLIGLNTRWTITFLALLRIEWMGLMSNIQHGISKYEGNRKKDERKRKWSDSNINIRILDIPCWILVIQIIYM